MNNINLRIRRMTSRPLYVAAFAFLASASSVADDCARISGCTLGNPAAHSEDLILLETSGTYISFLEIKGSDMEYNEKHTGIWSCSDGTLTLGSAMTGQLGRGRHPEGSADSSPDEIIVAFTKHLQYALKPPVVDRGEGVCTGIEPDRSASAVRPDARGSTPETSMGTLFEAVAGDAEEGRTDDAGEEKSTGIGVSRQAHFDESHGKSKATAGQSADVDVQAVYSPDADIFDHFGYAVSLSADGSTLAVGTPYDLERRPAVDALANSERDGHNASGTVSVYERVGGQWAEKARLRPSAGFFDDKFGYSVSLSADGSTLAVGARGTDSRTCQNKKRSHYVSPYENIAGAAYIFERSAAGRWVQHACLDGSDDDEEKFLFGEQVALSGDGQLLVITSEHKERRYNLVHVYYRSGLNWLRVSAPKSPTDEPYNLKQWRAGYAWSFTVNNDGSVIAISAQGWNTIFVYTRDESSTLDRLDSQGAAKTQGVANTLDGPDEPNTRGWQLSAVLEPPMSEIGQVAWLGMSVSLNGAGDRLVATAVEKIRLYRQADRGSKGCPKNCVKEDTSEDLPFYGLMVIYEMTVDGEWRLQAQRRVTSLIPGYVKQGIKPYTAAMSSDGDIIIVGGFSEDFLGTAYTSVADDGIPTIPTEMRNNPAYTSRPYGVVRLYPDERPNMQPGKLWGYETATWDRGYHRPKRAYESAWLTVRKDGVWQQPARIRPPGANQHDRFGQSVAIDAIGQTIAVGAPKRSAPLTDGRPAPLKYIDGILQSGAVFIYIHSDTDEPDTDE